MKHSTRKGLISLTAISSLVAGCGGGTGTQQSIPNSPVVVTPNTGTESVLYSFGAAPDGQSSWAQLTKGVDGNLYGVTYSGGANGLGTFFRVTPAGVEQVLYSFGSNSADAQQPVSAVIQANDGNFYGTTPTGGANGSGAAYMITPSGTETVIYSFGNGATDGTAPYASLVQGTDNKLYGVTSAGGANSAGTVFNLTLAGTESVLYSFDPTTTDGTGPVSALIQGIDGNFYGTAPAGGANLNGAVYSITPGGIETVIYSFNPPPDGTYPFAALVQDSQGNFYGDTYSGGTLYGGVVFKIDTSGNESVLYSFGTNTNDASDTKAPLILASDGYLYGTSTRGGENGNGAIFRITTAGIETPLYSFSSATTGQFPYATLTEGTGGLFYGTTISGGTNGFGVIYSYTP